MFYFQNNECVIAKTFCIAGLLAETVTGGAFELIKMQQALGFSSKIVNFCGPFIYRAAPRAPWLQACMISWIV